MGRKQSDPPEDPNEVVIDQDEPEAPQDDPTPPPAEPAERDDRLAQLRDRLKQGGHIDDETDPVPADDDAATPPAPTGADDADDDSDTDTPPGTPLADATPPSEDDQPDPATPTNTPPPDPDDLTFVDGSTIAPDIWRDLPADVQEAHHALRNAVVEARHERLAAQHQLELNRETIDFGSAVKQFTEKAKISQQGLDEWLQVGALVNAGSPQAVSLLQGYLEMLGAPAAPQQPQPAQLSPKLRTMVTNGVLTEDEALEIAGSYGSQTPPAQTPRPQPAATPAAQPMPSVFAKPGAQGQSQQQAPPADQAVTSANQQLAAFAAEMQAKHGKDWDMLRPLVKKELDKFEGAPPEQWLKIAKQSYQLVVAKQRAEKQRRRGRQQLSGGSGTAPAKPPKSVDELEGRSRIRELARRGQL